MLYKRLGCYFFCTLLAGCFGYSIGNVDKPNLYAYESWEKKGKSILDVKKDLLECGEPSVFEINYNSYEKVGIYGRDETVNYSYLTSRCMENLGYKGVDRTWFYKEKVCDSLDAKKYPACQPGAVIPTPSEEKRLNSHYCMIKKESYEECKDNTASTNCGARPYIPWECFTEEEAGEAQTIKRQRDSIKKEKWSSSVSDANPEAVRMRYQQLEMDLLQNQNRQETNKEMNKMMRK